MACADTSFLLDLTGRGGADRRRQAHSKLRTLSPPLFTTRLNVAELWIGVHRSKDPAGEARKILLLLAPFTILELDADSARLFGYITAHLQSLGTPIGDMDALIGALCLSTGHDLVTRNPRHFRRIPGLGVETY